MFSIEHPILFSLLIVLVIPVVIFSLYKTWRRRAVNSLGQEKNLKALLSNFNFKRNNRSFAFIIIVLVCLVLASVNFRKTDAAQSDMAKGLDVLIALDVSKSMLATDEKPSRLEKSKLLVKNVLSQLANDQVGLIVFAGKAYIQAPLTNDYNMVNMLLENAHPTQVPHMGTDIADPIHWSNELFDPEQMKYKVLLLITDGEDHNDQAITMAEKAKEQGIVIITVGIGSVEGTQLVSIDNNQPLMDEKGQVVISKLNEELLKTIAQTTGGEYVHLQNISTTGKSIVNAINRMEKKDIKMQNFAQYQSFFTIFALIAFVLLILDTFHLKFIKKKKNTLLTMWSGIMMMSLMGFSSAFAQSSSKIPNIDTAKSQLELYKGNKYYLMGQMDNAVLHYEQSLKYNSSNAITHFNMGNVYYHNNSLEQSRSFYNNVLRLSSAEPLRVSYAHYNSGNTYLLEKKYKEAIAEYIKALKLNPKDQDMKHNLTYALKKLKEQEDQDKKDNKDNQDQKDNKDQNDQENSENKDNPEQNKDQQPQNEEQKKQQKPQNKLNKEQLEANLQSISNNEKNIQKNKNKEGGQYVRPEKDW